MDQVRLNTIAIFVFVLTCSVLLGPWLNISPALPALAIVSVLGLVTFDALGFQGKGVTLFLDSFAQRSPVYKERILRHEAGHFLVAHLLEVPLTGYTLSAWEALKQGYPGQGGVMFGSPESERGNLSATLLDRYCTVWMAGGAAESLVYGTVEGGEDDLQKLRSTLTHLRLEWKSKQRSAVLQARDLLQSHWSAYEALVEAMAQRASTAECCQVIEHHRQETPAPSTF